MGAPIKINFKQVASLLDRLILSERSPGITPSEFALILAKANEGRNHNQSKFAEEICEKDPEIQAAVDIRQAAIQGLEWNLLPGDGSDGPDNVSRTIEQILRAITGNMNHGLLSFDQQIAAMATAFLPGFECAKIAWLPGGDNIEGFNHIPQHNFTFWRSRYMPRLRTMNDQENGIDLPDGPEAWIVHRHFIDGRDIPRTGLIRVLGWLYVWKTLNTKDLLRFREKFGMPFIYALMDNMFDNKGALTKEAKEIVEMLENFGSDGSALFTKNMDIKTVAPPNLSADIFFDSHELFTRQIAKSIIGQTSTQDSTNSNRSTADVHDGVRRDILLADTKSISLTMRQQPIAQLTRNIFGPDQVCPVMKFIIPKFHKSKDSADTIKTMDEAGWTPDSQEAVNDQVGNFNWRRKTDQETETKEAV